MLRLVVVIVALTCWKAALAEPMIAWMSDPAGPDDTVVVIGDQLEATGAIQISRMEDDPTQIRISSVERFETKPFQVSATSLKFVIPKQIGVGAYRFAFASSSGRQYELNAPSIYWMQGDQGTSSSLGGWVRVLGRNIGRNSEVRLALGSAAQSTPVILRPSKFSLWGASFVIPPDLPIGSYTVRLWNGNGDKSTWRDAGVLEIVKTRPIAPPLTLNVRDYGALGDGSRDDTEIIKSVLRVLQERGGGTIFLPRGFYRVSESLQIPAHVRLKGEDRRLVRLGWPDLQTPPFALIEGSSDFAIEDVTLVAANHGHIISGGFRSNSDVAVPNAGNISIQRVTVRASMYSGHLRANETLARLKQSLTFRAGSPDTVRLAGFNLQICDSDIYGSGRSLFLLNPKSAYIARNRLRNGRWGWYSLSGPDKVIFEDNEILGGDLQATGGGINTLGANLAQNVAFFGNKFEALMGWDREAVTSDGPGGCYFGAVNVLSSDGLSVGLSPRSAEPLDLSRCLGAGAYILGGRGIGQVRIIQSVDGETIRLDRPFAIAPDSSSIVAVSPYQRNYLVIGNEFSDVGIAVQFYGSAVDHVVANNVLRRTGGMKSWGLKYREFQPTWYVQFLSNRIVEGGIASDAVLAVWGAQKPPNSAPLSLGTIIRDNQLEGDAHIEAKGFDKAAPGLRDAIIEHNRITRVDAGIIVDEGARDVLVRDNMFHQVITPTIDKSVSTPQ